MHTTIQTLWNQGHNKSEIARMVGHDWKTISKAVACFKSGQTLPDKKPHPSLLDPYVEQLISWAEEGLSAVRIQEELSALGLKVGYTTVKTRMAEIKGNRNIFIRVHTPAGEEAQVDFGYVGYSPDETGRRRKTWVFNMRLSYSRLDYYEVVYDQRVETFIQCHINAFNFFGGVPRSVKIDNLKAAILEAHFYEPIHQKLYLQMAEYYDFQSLPCRVYRPNDKGKVESGIKYVKCNFFAGRKFNTHQELKEKLSKWQEKANSRIHGTTQKEPRQVFDSEEKSFLNPLPLKAFNLAQVGTRKVYHDCHIFIKHNYYSVPFSYVGKSVEVSVDPALVNIFYGDQLIATHAVLRGRGQFSTQKSHYPKYKCLSETEMQEKYQAKMAELGPHAEQIFFALMDHQPTNWIRLVQGVLSLTKKYSKQVLDQACQRALAYEAYSYRRIQSICENATYLLPLDSAYLSHQEEVALWNR
jgi:transposase